MSFLRILFILCLAVLPMNAFAYDEADFQNFLQNVGREALAQGVTPRTVQSALASVTVDETVVELDRKQPEKKITFARYLQNVVNQPRIDKGRRLMDDYAGALAKLEKHFGVPPAVVISLWGMESSFGANKGDFSVLSSLATLAYEGRRADFFRKELIEAMKIMDEEGLTPDQMLGSWAGAMGHCQFMPSTYRKYAVDADGDGHRDIWDNELDVIASIASYLAAEGWQRDQRWGREVKLAKDLPDSEVGLDNLRPLADWGRLGVHAKGSNALPQNDLSASLIQPDGADGRSFLVYDNFRALMRWNRSTYFATSVGLLADTIANGS